MTAPYLCRCPACQTPLKLKDDTLIGKRIKCPKCAGVVVVPGPEGTAPAAPAPAAAPTPKAAPAAPPAARPVPPASAVPMAKPVSTSPDRPVAAAQPSVPLAKPVTAAQPSVPLAKPVAALQAPVPIEEPIAPPSSFDDEPADKGPSTDEEPPFAGRDDEPAARDDEPRRKDRPRKPKTRGVFGIIHVIVIVLIVTFLGLAAAVKLNVIGDKPPVPVVSTGAFGQPWDNAVPKPWENPDLKNPINKNNPDKTIPKRTPPKKTDPDKTNQGASLPYPPFNASDAQKAQQQRAALSAKEDAIFKTLTKARDGEESNDCEMVTFATGGYVISIAFSPDSKWLAVGDIHGKITLVDLTTGQYEEPLMGHAQVVVALAFSPDGRTLVSSSGDNTIRFWDLTATPKAEVGPSISLGKGNVAQCMAFSPDGTLLASGSDDFSGHAIRTWNTASHEETTVRLKSSAIVNSLAFRSDGKVLAALKDHESTSFFDPLSGQAYDRTEKNEALRVEFAAEGSFLASYFRDGGGKRQLIHPRCQKGKEESLEISFQCGNKNVEAATILLPTLLGPKSRRFSSRFGIIDLNTLSFSPGGQFLAAAGGGFVKLWYVPDLQNDALLRTMEAVGTNGSLRRSGAGFVLDIGSNLGDADLEKLPPNPLVTTLNLSGNDKITNAGLSNLRKFRNLRVLNLSFNPKIDASGLKVLADLTKLEILHLEGNEKVTDTAAVHIGQLPELKELYLDSTSITGAALDKLRTLRNLRVLNLPGCAIGDPGDLNMLTKLVELNLADCSMTDPGMSHLVRLSSLETLHLHDNPKVTDAGIASLKGLTKLKYLDLGQTGIGDQGLANLKDLTSLQTLLFNNTKVTDAGFEHLANLTNLSGLNCDNLEGFTGIGLKHLARLENLNFLSLGQTKVTDEGMVGVKDLKQLISIDLPPGLSDKGFEPLAGLPNLTHVNPGMMPKLTGPGLKYLAKVISLNLVETGITDAGLANLKDLKTLNYLSLPPRITDAGLTHLQNLEMLNNLDLHGTQVTDVGLKQLMGLKKLQYLNVNETKVSATGIEELKKALPELRVEKAQ